MNCTVCNPAVCPAAGVGHPQPAFESNLKPKWAGRGGFPFAGVTQPDFGRFEGDASSF